MTENAVRFLAKNELGHFSTARFWPGPSLDWGSPHWHLMGFLCYSSLVYLYKIYEYSKSMRTSRLQSRHLRMMLSIIQESYSNVLCMMLCFSIGKTFRMCACLSVVVRNYQKSFHVKEKKKQ